jgi:hypothetical protein
MLAAAVASFVLVAAATAHAGTIKFGGDDSDYREGGGGEFIVEQYSNQSDLPTPGHSPRPSSVSHPTAAIFHTFCAERLNNQGFNLAGTYTYLIASESSAWNDGGGNATAVGVGTETTRALDTHTAYLFSQFYFGTLGDDTATLADDYDYTPGSGRSASAAALQKALWYFQTSTGSYGEQWALPALGTLERAYIDMANAAVSSGAWNGIGAVRILQLTDSNGISKQDTFTMVPLPPAALAGFGLLGGLALLGLKRRRPTSL